MYKYNYILSDSERSQNYKKIFINKIPKNWIFSENDYEYLFVIGGDGTLFRNASMFLNRDCKVIPINGGNFGFYALFDENNIDNIFFDIFKEENYVKPWILEATLDKNIFYSINDIYISSFLVTSIDILINKKFYEKFKGSGLLFSTPIGSTALNKNSGGAVILDDISCYQMNEIQPIRQINFRTLGSSLILSEKFEVDLIFKSEINEYNFLIDGIKIQNNFCNKMNIKLVKSLFKLYNPRNERIEKIKKAYIEGEAKCQQNLI